MLLLLITLTQRHRLHHLQLLIPVTITQYLTLVVRITLLTLEPLLVMIPLARQVQRLQVSLFLQRQRLQYLIRVYLGLMQTYHRTMH